MNDNDNMTMTYRRQLTNITNSTFKNALRVIRDVTRSKYWFSCVVCLKLWLELRNLLMSTEDLTKDKAGVDYEVY